MSDGQDEQMLCQKERQMLKYILVGKRLLYQMCHLFQGPALLTSIMGYELVGKVKQNSNYILTTDESIKTTEVAQLSVYI